MYYLTQVNVCLTLPPLQVTFDPPSPLRICLEYDQFRVRALRVPEDSREMMDLIAYMETARTELVRELWEAVQVCVCEQSKNHISLIKTFLDVT